MGRIWSNGSGLPINAANLNGIENDLSLSIKPWKANTGYTAGQAVLDPTSNLVTANANHTSGTSFNPANWSNPLGNAKLIYVTTAGSDSNSGLSWGSAKATLSAALTAAGNSGTVIVGDGSFSLGATLAPDVNNSILGQGSMRTTFTVDFDGLGIDWKPQTTFSGNAAGTMQGFSIVAGTGAANNAAGLKVSSLIKPKLRDIRAANFTGTSGIGIWFQNIAIGGTAYWTERISAREVVTVNNTIGVCFDVNGGTNSFMYAEDLSFTVNVNAVASGLPAQYGYMVRGGAVLERCNVNFMGNVAGVNGSNTVAPVFLRVQDTGSDIAFSSLSIRGEMTSGTSGTSISVGNGARIFGSTGVIAFVKTAGFAPQFDSGSAFGHSGTIAGGIGGDLASTVDQKYLLSTTREAGATNGILFNRATGASTTEPVFAMVSHPPTIGGKSYGDGDLVVMSYDGTTLNAYIWYRYVNGAPQVHALAPLCTSDNRSIATKTLTSGTGTQFGTGDKSVSVPVTFNATSSAAATCLVEVSPDGTTYTAIGTWTKPANSTAGQIEIVRQEIPHSWYLRLTATNATLGTATYY